MKEEIIVLNVFENAKTQDELLEIGKIIFDDLYKKYFKQEEKTDKSVLRNFAAALYHAGYMNTLNVTNNITTLQDLEQVETEMSNIKIDCINKKYEILDGLESLICVYNNTESKEKLIKDYIYNWGRRDAIEHSQSILSSYKRKLQHKKSLESTKELLNIIHKTNN